MTRVSIAVLLLAASSTIASAQESREVFLRSVPATATAGEPITLTLPSAIERALAHNLGIVTSRHEIARADAVRLRSLSDLLPRVEARVGDSVQTTNLAAFGFDPSLFPGMPPIIGPFSVFDARVDVSPTVLDLGAVHSLRGARHGVEAARLDAQNARDIVVLVVTDLYLHALADSRRLSAVGQQVQTAEELLKLATNLHDAGATAGIDVVRARVQVQAQRQRLIAAENDFSKRKLQLARAIGLPASQRIDVTASDAAPATSLGVEDAVQQALQTRSDYRAALARVAAASEERRAARAEAYPTVQAHVDVGTLGSTLPDARRTYAVSGTVRVPLFDTARRSREAQAAAMLAERQAEAADFAQRLEADVRTAFLDVQAAEQQLAVARDRLDLAQQELSLAQTRFAAGVTSNLEVIQAQDTLATAAENEISSVYAADVARATLARVVGSNAPAAAR
jgi:outer membrane protein TolC